MKTLRFFSLLIAVLGFNAAIAQSNLQAGTVVIKHPSADNAAAFFSGATMYNFEVYKAGSAQELAKIVAAFQKDKDVESFTVGTLTGDYQAFTLVLKTKKSKTWFSTAFKNAGLNFVRLNRAEPVAVDKL